MLDTVLAGGTVVAMTLTAIAGGLGPDAIYLGDPGSPRVAPDHLVEPGGRERAPAAGLDRGAEGADAGDGHLVPGGGQGAGERDERVELAVAWLGREQHAHGVPPRGRRWGERFRVAPSSHAFTRQKRYGVSGGA